MDGEVHGEGVCRFQATKPRYVEYLWGVLAVCQPVRSTIETALSRQWTSDLPSSKSPSEAKGEELKHWTRRGVSFMKNPFSPVGQYIYIYTHRRMHIYIHTYMYIYIYIQHICTYVCMQHVYIQTFVYTSYESIYRI